ncbi:MAG: ATP-binding domain-containing protein, partial [Prolixibacteraceae bacterium]|nr:ATP-binding domain-containing protein [Prolixibacteraceae bacterium]MBN2773839.1 ATP-binding domain-containing protein [Prolixibacteraceae bacterium]
KEDILKLPVQESLKKLKKDFYNDVDFDEQEFRRLLILAENKSPAEFVSLLKMGSSSDTYTNQLEAVALMTLHASKGLEFECVFITGCEQGLIPYNLYNKDADINEEARLLYVGMTRSKKFLYLSHARSRIFRNRVLQLSGSRFLDKIEKELIEKIKNEYKQKKDPGKQLDLFNL